MNLKPIGDHLILEAEKIENPISSAFYIPDSASKEKPERGVIIAVGAGRQLANGKLSSMPVSIGQTVVFKKYAPDEIKLDGKDFLVITVSDIIAVIE